MAVSRTFERRNSDVFIDVHRPDYTCVNSRITNPATTALALTRDQIVAYPVKSGGNAGWQFLQPGDEVNCEGLILEASEGIEVAAGADTEREYAIVVRGPAVINFSNLDPSFASAAIATALAAKNPPVVEFTDDSVSEFATI